MGEQAFPVESVLIFHAAARRLLRCHGCLERPARGPLAIGLDAALRSGARKLDTSKNLLFLV